MKDDPVEVRAVLIVEEGEDDARLMIEALRRDGLEPSWRRVDTLSSLGTALESQEWDVVLSSRNLPGFDAWETLRQVRESSTDAPFILVSDAIGEEEAVAFVKAGAADFLLQSDLSRLPSAVVRAIAETKSRRRQREFEEHLRASESSC
jgi:DNA-binding NtrC family response regulator